MSALTRLQQYAPQGSAGDTSATLIIFPFAKTTVSLDEVKLVLLNPIFALLIVAASGVAFMLNNQILCEFDCNRTVAFAMWIIATATHAGIYLGSIALLCVLPIFQRWPIYEPALLLICTTIASPIGFGLFLYFGLTDSELADVITGSVLRTYIPSEIAAICYFWFLRDRLLPKPEAEVTDRSVSTLQVAGVDYPWTNFVYARAQNQYVEVVTKNGKQLHIGSLKSISEQVSEDQGIMIHRSYFVSKSAVNQIRVDDGKVSVSMANGDRIPVARRLAVEVKRQLNHAEISR